MKLMRSFVIAAIAASALVVGVQAQNKEADERAEKRAEAVNQIGVAAQLASFGRGELAEASGLKGFKSPEALVSAGGILIRVHRMTGGKFATLEAKVTDDKKEVVKEEATRSLADQADDLFTEALAMTNKDNKAKVEALIKMAKAEGEERGACGGPRVKSCVVPSGGYHECVIAFEPGQPASVTVNSSRTVKLVVIGPGGQELFHSNPGRSHTYNWRTAGKKLRDVTIRIVNQAGPAAPYTMTTN